MTPEEFAKIEAGLTALGTRAATVIQGLAEALGSFAGYVEQVCQERDRLIRQHDQVAARNAALTAQLADALRGQLRAREEHDHLLHSLKLDRPPAVDPAATPKVLAETCCVDGCSQEVCPGKARRTE